MECYYWRESDSGNKRITVTQDKESATKFSICLENANHQNEFEIQKFQKGVPAERLGCDVTFSGCSPENSPRLPSNRISANRVNIDFVSKIRIKRRVTKQVLVTGSQAVNGFSFVVHDENIYLVERENCASISMKMDKN